MTKRIISMTISFSDSKNFLTGSPRSFKRPITIPNTIENITKPSTFMLRAAISRPAGTVSDPGAINCSIVVKLWVSLLEVLFRGSDETLTISSCSLYCGETCLYLVLFYKEKWNKIFESQLNPLDRDLCFPTKTLSVYVEK